MSLLQTIHNEFHALLAAFTGSAASVVAPVPETISKIVIGAATGLLTWTITKIAAWVLSKLQKDSCECPK